MMSIMRDSTVYSITDTDQPVSRQDNEMSG